MSEALQYREIFDYLSTPFLPEDVEPGVVFGRADNRVAFAAADLITSDSLDVLAITGGVGKDSGRLLSLGFRSEAHYLLEVLNNCWALPDADVLPVLMDEKANNGLLNARNATRLLKSNGYQLDHMTAIGHATSVLRLASTLERRVEQVTGSRPVVHRAPSTYKFDGRIPEDQNEAAMELLRLAEWPRYGVLNERPDLPMGLVQFARERHGHAPKPPSVLGSIALSHLPKSLQVTFLQHAAGQSTAK